MERNDFAAMDEGKLVELLSMAQHVMAGLTRTILLMSKTITSENLDGAVLTREAAQIVADMLLYEAAQLRKAGRKAEADIRVRAVEQFNMVIRETLRRAPTRQQVQDGPLKAQSALARLPIGTARDW